MSLLNQIIPLEIGTAYKMMVQNKEGKQSTVYAENIEVLLSRADKVRNSI
jgi:hypothetical protein